MPVIESQIDRERLALEVTAEFDAPVERVWLLWEDPRQIERWWGPPGWPAAFTRHEFLVDGESRYHMTGPDGEISAAWFRMTRIEHPRLIEFDDGFSSDDGEPDLSMPVMHFVVTLEPLSPARTRMLTVVTAASLEDLEKVVGMGMIEGMSAAMGQIDAILAG